jgi:hypothetical protein
VITGESLPDTLALIDSVDFAISPCTIDFSTLSSTTVECTLDLPPTCGSHQVILTSVNGIIPNSASVESVSVDCTITKIEPSSADSLNLIGADNITISGTNFPRDFVSSTVEIEFNDA